METRPIKDIISTLRNTDSGPGNRMLPDEMYIERYAISISEAYDPNQAFGILDDILGSEHANYPNVSIFEALINKCIQFGKIDDYALDIYNIANSVSIVSINMHTSMIIGAAHHLKRTIANMACQNAIKQMEGNYIAFHAMIDSLVASKNGIDRLIEDLIKSGNNIDKLVKSKNIIVDIAKEIYKVSNIQPAITRNKEGKIKKIDVHGFHHGSAYIALLAWLDEEKIKANAEQKELSLIEIVIDPGKGIHSRYIDKNLHHPVKAGVLHFIHEMEKIYDFRYTENDDTGLIICNTIKQKPIRLSSLPKPSILPNNTSVSFYDNKFTMHNTFSSSSNEYPSNSSRFMPAQYNK